MKALDEIADDTKFFAAVLVFAWTNTLWLAMAALSVAGFCLVAAQTCNSTLIQNAVDPALRARVVSLNGVVIVSGPAIGAIVVGWVAERTGVQWPVMVAAALALVILALLFRRVASNAAELERTVD